MASKKFRIARELVEKDNKERSAALEKDYAELGGRLKRRGIGIDEVLKGVMSFKVAVPSWGMGTGGTRFGKFPLPGQPRDIFDKLDDAAAINDLTGATPRISLHIPWDKTDNPSEVKKYAKLLGLGFDAMNSNTFEDQPGQKHSYKFGSLSHSSGAVREQAVAHHLDVIGIGRELGAKALSIWIGDGANSPGQTGIGDSFERYLDSLHKIYRALPKDWIMFIEYKPFEPSFYYTVLADWGSALMASMEVGERCKALVDLGHHLPGTNIEAIVARLIRAKKLGGFHLNDNHYADDDLSAASIYPYRLFRIFHELILAGKKLGRSFRPAYLIDQSHNLKDPIEELIQTITEMQIIWARALLVDHKLLKSHQDKNDVIMAEMELKEAFNTDVGPITAMARIRAGASIAPIAVYRKSGYRNEKARERA